MGLQVGWGGAHQEGPQPRVQHGCFPRSWTRNALGKPALKANRETVLFVGAEQRAPRVHKASLPGPHSVCLSSGGEPLGTQGGDARPAKEVLLQEGCYSRNQKTWGWSRPAAQDSHTLPSGSPSGRRVPEATWVSGSLRDDGVTCKAWCLSAVLTTLSAAGEGGKDYGARQMNHPDQVGREAMAPSCKPQKWSSLRKTCLSLPGRHQLPASCMDSGQTPHPCTSGLDGALISKHIPRVRAQSVANSPPTPSAHARAHTHAHTHRPGAGAQKVGSPAEAARSPLF